jgi:hypothetical protein
VDIEAFRRDGALRIAGLFDAAGLVALDMFEVAGPGVRLQDARLEAAIAPATDAATALLDAVARPVRAVLFDKTAEANWLVAWHQDRTIPIRERRDAPGFGPWSRKDGILHVMPPVGVLERMVTVRIHIDPVGPDNAPLRAALGSHGIGLVPAAEAAATAARLPQIVCLAAPGDVWAYSTPILHASDRAAAPTRRRVLQVDYAVDDLPYGLEWSGVA